MNALHFLRLLLLWLLLRSAVARAEEAQPFPTNAPPSLASVNHAPPKKKLPPVIPLSLTNVLSAEENKDWLRDGVWSVVPHGRTNDFAGVRCWLEGIVQLQGKASAAAGAKHREKVTLPLPQPTNFATLHLLGGMSWDAPANTKVAEVVWRYTDGSFKRAPLQYGVQMRDWWGRRYEDPATVSDAHSKAVWRGAHPDASKWGKYLRFYLTSLPNPDTNKPVKAVEFVSALANPTLFLVGVTLDSLPPGTRDDDFRDLDLGRPGLTGTQYVTVLDAVTSKPIAGAKVKTHGREREGTPDFSEYDREGVTAANGVAAVPKSQDGLERLEIRVEAENYVSLRKEVNLKKGEVLPPNLELKLKGGLTLGGLVQDPDGQPLAGAKVQVSRIYRGGEDRQTEDFDPNFYKDVTTDAEGKWTVKSVPAPLLPDIYISASHADYVSSEGQIVGGNAKLEEELKKHTHIIKLARGFDVSGLVVGPDDKPFAGAKVKAGRRWNGDSNRETTTGDDGRFYLRNVKGELQAVTATADGYTPATEAITPGTNVTEVTLHLKRGASLKGVVVNPEGEPLAGARLVYEPQNRDFESQQRNNLEWEGTTDDTGRFEWKSAPEGESVFYVYKEGYAQRRGVKAKSGEEDNIIKLSRPRKVLGVVGDSQTSRPLTNFYVWPASGDENGFHSWSDSNKQEFSDPDGHFTLELTDDEHNVIKVGGTDHSPKFVVLPQPQNDYVTVTVLLDPAESPKGTVVDAAGQPVPGVSVGLLGSDPQNGLSLARGRLRNDNGGNIQKSDDQGHFELPVVAGPRKLVAASEAGYGEATWEDFQQSKTIVLLPWGRIQGTLYVTGKPAEGQGVMLNAQTTFDGGSLNMDWNTYRALTDADGKFTINFAPPGERNLVRLIQTSPNSWLHSHNTAITVRPGETTTVNLGNTGAIISGRLNATAVTAGLTNFVFHGNLNTPFPQPPSGQTTPEAFRAWQQSPEFQAAYRQVKNYGVVVNPDGSFSVDGVEPGTYSLNLNAASPRPGGRSWETVPLGSFSQSLTVGDEAADRIVQMDIGEVALQPTPRLGGP